MPCHDYADLLGFKRILTMNAGLRPVARLNKLLTKHRQHPWEWEVVNRQH